MTILVTDYRRSAKFYLQALKSLGYAMTMELDDVTYPELPSAFFAGLGVAGKPDLWLRPSKTVAPTHVAFRAESRSMPSITKPSPPAAHRTASPVRAPSTIRTTTPRTC